MSLNPEHATRVAIVVVVGNHLLLYLRDNHIITDEALRWSVPDAQIGLCQNPIDAARRCLYYKFHWEPGYVELMPLGTTKDGVAVFFADAAHTRIPEIASNEGLAIMVLSEVALDRLIEQTEEGAKGGFTVFVQNHAITLMSLMLRRRDPTPDVFAGK